VVDRLRQTEIGSVVLLVLGAMTTLISLWFAVETWITVQRIEALGTGGQAAAREEYREAAGVFHLAVIGVAMGVGMWLIGAL
jgi:hypothetical protein